LQHIAILNKSWKFLELILSGKKTIESRWYKTKKTPYGQIHSGDTIYFKNSGEPVAAKVEVKKVLEFSNLNPAMVDEILKIYGNAIGIRKEKIPMFRKLFKDKKYCALIFLKDPQGIKPFNIDKKGYGNMAAWMCVNDVDWIRL